MAGVMKGLQAVLVFVATHFLYCGKTGGSEMCFTNGKFSSLVTVVGGVFWFSFVTPAGSTAPLRTKRNDEHTNQPVLDLLVIAEEQPIVSATRNEEGLAITADKQE